MQGGFGKTGRTVSRELPRELAGKLRCARAHAAFRPVQRHVFDDHKMLGDLDALDQRRCLATLFISLAGSGAASSSVFRNKRR